MSRPPPSSTVCASAKPAFPLQEQRHGRSCYATRGSQGARRILCDRWRVLDGRLPRNLPAICDLADSHRALVMVDGPMPSVSARGRGARASRRDGSRRHHHRYLGKASAGPAAATPAVARRSSNTSANARAHISFPTPLRPTSLPPPSRPSSCSTPRQTCAIAPEHKIIPRTNGRQWLSHS